jgi:hypothetical protein
MNKEVHTLQHIYTKQLFILYLEFKFDCTFFILFDNPENLLSDNPENLCKMHGKQS